MDSLEHVEGITEQIQQEASRRQKIELFRRAILLVLSHKGSDIDELVADIAHDLDAKYRAEEITMQERIELMFVLNGR